MEIECVSQFMFTATKIGELIIAVNEGQYTVIRDGVVTHVMSMYTCQCGIIVDLELLEEYVED